LTKQRYGQNTVLAALISYTLGQLCQEQPAFQGRQRLLFQIQELSYIIDIAVNVRLAQLVIYKQQNSLVLFMIS
jgi:hypothetical protein